MKRIFVLHTLVCMLLLLCGQAQAQPGSKTITGAIYGLNTKSQKEPLTGAIINDPVSNKGTAADKNGNFSITIPDTATMLIASYAGYIADTLSLSPGMQSLVITLKQLHNLKEVVIRKQQKSTKINLYGATKMETLGKAELLKAACCNLSESFETTPSIDVGYTDAVSGYKQIMMLGLAGPYTSITRENIPDARGLAAISGLTFTPGTWIEGIQLSKGTGSVVNGFESVAGQINVELKKPFEEDDERLFLNLYQNTQGRTEVNVQYRHEFNEHLSTSLFLHNYNMWMKTDQNKDNFLDQPLGNRFVGLNRWFYAGPNGLEIQAGIKGAFVNNTGGAWNYTSGTEQTGANPWGYTQQTTRIEEWMKLGKIFERPGTSVGLQLSGTQHNQTSAYGNRTYQAKQNSYYANLIYQTYLGNSNHILKTGASSMFDKYDEQFNAAAYRRTEVVPGIFAEYAYKHLEKLDVVAGMRGDYNSLYGAFATPRLHVRYSPYERTSIRASLGRAQRTANIFAENMGLMASTRNFNIISALPGKAYGLNPEVAWSTGINVTQKFTMNNEEAVISADFYRTSFTNQIVVDMETPRIVEFYNLTGQSYANSFQIQFDYELVHNLNMRLAYRYYDIKTTYGNTLKEKPLIPAHRAFANIGYATKNNWKFDYTIQWVGQKRIPIRDNGKIAEQYSKAYIQMNAQITKVVNDRLDIYIGSENMTNFMQDDAIINPNNPFGQDFDAGMIWGPMMGRDVYVGVRYRIP